ncbi:hypothetical protein Tco_0279961, partial [Tanacetum coccineum]
ARIDADRILVARLQEEERESFTVEQRAKFLHDTIVAQRRFLAKQRSADIRRNFKHADLIRKKFEEIQTLYERQKKFDQSFIPINSARDEKMIDKLNKKAAGMDKVEVPKEHESNKVEGH